MFLLLYFCKEHKTVISQVHVMETSFHNTSEFLNVFTTMFFKSSNLTFVPDVSSSQLWNQLPSTLSPSSLVTSPVGSFFFLFS